MSILILNCHLAMETVMASLCHQHVLYHLLVFGLRRGPVILDTHVYIVAKIFNRWLSSYISQGIGPICTSLDCIHLSNWSLVMNLSREQCTMQDRKLPSHTSHMNLTGDGAGVAVREASRTEISVRLTRAMLGHMGCGVVGGLRSTEQNIISLAHHCTTTAQQQCTAVEQSHRCCWQGRLCECYPAPAVVCCCASQQQQSNWEMGRTIIRS